MKDKAIYIYIYIYIYFFLRRDAKFVINEWNITLYGKRNMWLD